MAGPLAPHIHGATETAAAAGDPVITPEVCARAVRMVINSAQDAADATVLLQMLGLIPDRPAARHLRVVA